MNSSENTSATEQIRLERRLPSYWRVTFDIPPLNIFGPREIPQLNEIIAAIETDDHLKVVVFDSAVEGFLSHALRFSRAARGFHSHPSRANRSPGAAGHAGASEPRSCRLHRFNPGQSDRSRKRARARQRHEICEPPEGHPFAMGGRRGTGEADRWRDCRA